MVAPSPTLAAGLSDCEQFDTAWLLQPVNAVSSLGFSLVGLLILRWAIRVQGQERIARVVFGTALIATGIGSFMFHGFDTAVAQFLHDVTFLALIVLLVTMNVSPVRGWRSATGWMVAALGVVTVSLVLLIAPDRTNIITIVATIALIGSDVLMEHRGGIARRWWIASLAAMSVAIAAFVLGRTGAPLCDPDSIFQGHALWHLLSAAAIAMYFVATSTARVRIEASM